MDPDKADAIARAIRRLTLAVWTLVALVAVHLAMYLSVYIPALMNTSWDGPFVSKASPKDSPPRQPYKDLSELPPEEAIRESSVILLTKFKAEGGKGTCEITEILKHAPDVRFYYAVGDEMRFCSYDPNDGSDHGTGQLVFLVGNPAEFRLSTTYFGDRVSTFGDMPIEQLRKIIAEQAANPPVAPKAQ